ncbi:MAG: sulfatase-like hydrolase/transferase [Vicinamibacterales bacterium]|nr:sulfatase-like hydrolase/transferase [Vicinamibacterales bacterium]
MRRVPSSLGLLTFAALVLIAGCGRSDGPQPGAATTGAARPSILLVTLDTTRADAIGPDAVGIETPAFNALAARGRRFRHAYATTPETLPSHASMMTGLYPGGHGIHENARYLSPDHPVVAEQLRESGYRTAAFVSSFVLSRRFGLARGFDAYDDALDEGRVERSARETTDRALAFLAQPSDAPVFLWVHYFDPHTPYAPPEPYLSRFPENPYLGEVAAMDEQLGRLIEAFDRQAPGPIAIIVSGDHGEGLGDHGERQHGSLLYQPTMQVPMVMAGPGIAPGVSETPASIRRIFHTIRDWAGLDAEGSLRGEPREIVLGEAMKPFLSYGWQPQIMAVDGTRKAILAGPIEVYDLAADPGETRDLFPGAGVPAALRQALDDYPVPSPEAARGPEGLSDEARRNLASLGYVSSSVAPPVRRDAPRPADMVHLFEVIERASGLFVAERYREVVPLLEQILAEDAYNLDAALRLATAFSSLGEDARAVEMFRRAATIAPLSADVRTYLALHYARGAEWRRAVPLLEQIVADTPDRLPAVEALAVVREREGRIGDAVDLRQRVYGMRTPSPAELVQLGQMAMHEGRTPLALESFEAARRRQPAGFAHDLELGVLYMDVRRFPEAREALDRVPDAHPEIAMALFKRAQVSVLLKEPDAAARIARARERADETTRELIAREALFRGLAP